MLPALRSRSVLLRALLPLLGLCATYAADPASGGTAPATDANPPRWRYETMRPGDLQEALRSRAIAWLVVSPLEWHGEAIAFSADPVVGMAVAETAWKRVGGVLIPTLYLGAETEYKQWEKDGLKTYWGMEVISKEHNPGSLYLRPTTLELVVRDYLAALQREGFKLCVVVTGHGALEHVQVLEEVCRRPFGAMRTLVWRAGHSENLPMELEFKNVGPHADVSEASLVGAVNDKLVDRAAFGVTPRDRKTGLRHENAGDIDFAKGRAVIDFNARQLAEAVERLQREEAARAGP